VENKTPAPKGVKRKFSAAEILDRWQQIAGLVSGATIVASILYNWAYFDTGAPSAIGFMTIADYTSTFLDLLPISLLLVLIVFGSAIFLTSNNVIAPLWALPKGIKYIVGLLFLLLLLGFWVAPPYYYFYMAQSVFALWYLLVIRLTYKKTWSNTFKVCLLYVPLILIASIAKGNENAVNDFGQIYLGDDIITTQDGKDILDANIIRIMDRGLLIKLPRHEGIQFIPWDNIRQVKLDSNNIGLLPRFCTVFGLSCWQ